MKRTVIDLHILHTVPPSNLNRDDTGSPKSAIYGGVRRSRVSSQAWKRAVRKDFADKIDRVNLGRRTKQVGAELSARILGIAGDLRGRADELAAEAMKAAGIKTSVPKKKAGEGEALAEEAGYLVFLSNLQYDKLAAAAVEAERAGEKLDPKKARKIVDADHSIDIALFGRMVADAPDLNVDAACQVAHAISVHAVDNEFDYYTAVDDRKQDVEETGAGMIGSVEFNSATLYRYATIDAANLLANLGDADAVRRAVEAFIRSFATSMPTGKQNTFANRTLPDLVAVRIRETQSINLVGAFEQAVTRSAESGHIDRAVHRLAEHAEAVEGSFGHQPDEKWATVAGVNIKVPEVFGETLPLPALVEKVGEVVASRLGES